MEAIFHADAKGYGLTTLPVDDVYLSLQAASRHRHNLVKQRARLMVQIRRLMHQTMPGFADLFDEDKLFHKSIALPIALEFSSADAITQAGVDGIARYLRNAKVRFQVRTIEKVVAWAGTAVEPSELALLHSRQWKELNDVRQLLSEQIFATEREMAGFLGKTPYILLLSVTGINVVSAARLAGEAGPIEHYDSAMAINGRAGLYPSRYQSDEADRADGALVRQCNRKLRGAAMMVYQLVAGRQVWRGQGVDREYLLAKLQEFHQVHKTPLEQAIRDLNAAFQWLPESAYAAEAQPLEALVTKKHRGPKPIGELIIPLLIRLGIQVPKMSRAAVNGYKILNTEHEVMRHVVEAIYENGILRPEQPLPLTNRERVRLVVERLDRGSHSVLDIPPVSLGEVIDPLQVEHDLLGEMLEGRS